jgi:hypothetical protein
MATSIFFKNTPAVVAMMQVIEFPSVAPLTIGLLQVSELGTGA